MSGPPDDESVAPPPVVAVEESVVAAARVHAVAPQDLEEIDDLSSYLGLVGELNAEGPQLWFRGVRKASYGLTPSLFRHPTMHSANDLLAREWELLNEFRQRAPPFVGRLPTENVELLFMMQHYGVPTRLLDWTENPLVALFFALENAREVGASDHDAAIWVIDPARMNHQATKTQDPAANYVLSAYADELNAYLPRREPAAINKKAPLAMYGVHNSARIVAQRGGFVLFGRDMTPLELSADLSGPEGLVRKILIKRDFKDEMFRELFRLGVSDSVIYPDLDGLGRELKNRWGF